MALVSSHGEAAASIAQWDRERGKRFVRSRTGGASRVSGVAVPPLLHWAARHRGSGGEDAGSVTMHYAGTARTAIRSWVADSIVEPVQRLADERRAHSMHNSRRASNWPRAKPTTGGGPSTGKYVVTAWGPRTPGTSPFSAWPPWNSAEETPWRSSERSIPRHLRDCTRTGCCARTRTTRSPSDRSSPTTKCADRRSPGSSSQTATPQRNWSRPAFRAGHSVRTPRLPDTARRSQHPEGPSARQARPPAVGLRRPGHGRTRGPLGRRARRSAPDTRNARTSPA